MANKCTNNKKFLVGKKPEDIACLLSSILNRVQTLENNQGSGGGGDDYTDEDAQDAIGSILSGEFSYDDTAPSISINSIAWGKITGVPSFVTSASNGLSLFGTIAQFGQAIGAMGNPAALTSNREIPTGGKSINFIDGNSNALIFVDQTVNTGLAALDLVGGYGGLIHLKSTNTVDRIFPGIEWYYNNIFKATIGIDKSGSSGGTTNHLFFDTPLTADGVLSYNFEFGGNGSVVIYATGSTFMGLIGNKNVKIGDGNPASATLHIAAGAAGVGKAPLKLTSGTNLTTPEAGAIEWDGTRLYISQTSGPTRKTIAYTTDVPTSLPMSSLTGSLAINNIDNGNFRQTWTWNTDPSGSQLGILLSSSSTDLSSAGQARLLELTFTANQVGGTVSSPLYIRNVHTAAGGANIGADIRAGGSGNLNTGIILAATGSGTINTGLSVSATSGTANYAIIVPVSSGLVGIGTSTPTTILHVVGTPRFVTGNEANGKVFTSDATGIGNWQTPTSASLSPLGDIVSTTFPGVSIPAGFVQLTGGATISYSSGLNMSGGTGAYSNNFVRSTYVSWSNNYGLTTEFTVNTKPTSTSEGLVLKKISSSGTNLNMYVTATFSDSTHMIATLRIVSGSGDGTVSMSTLPVSMANGNKYRLTVRSSNNTIYIRLALLVASVETEVVDNLWTVPINTSPILANVGTMGIGVLGGSYTITSLKHTDYDLVGADVLVLGTSITQGHFPTSFENHYLAKALKGTGKTYINCGSSAAKFSDAVAAGALTEIIAMAPKLVIIEMGVNDTNTEINANAGTVIDALQAAGITVAWITTFIDAVRNASTRSIANTKNIRLLEIGLSMAAGMYTDGTHPNDLGYTYMAKMLKGGLPEYFGNTGGIEQYSLFGLKDVLITTPTNGQSLTYNSTTGQWNNTSPGSLFILNQTLVSQSATAWMSGFLSTDSGLGIGGVASSSFMLQILENTSNGKGAVLTNASAAGTNKSLVIVQYGSSGFGVTGWASAAVLEGQANGGLVLSGYGGTVLFQTGTSRTSRGVIDGSGNMGIGIVASVAARLHLVSTTEQLRIAYDASNYLSITSSSTGVITLNAVGTGSSFSFSDPVILPAGAAAASKAPLKLTSGTNLTTAEAGAMEYDGTNLFFTKTGTTRGNILVATAVTTEVLVSDTSLTVTYNGTTYKLLARA